MRDFIWGNKGGIRLELDSCGIPLFCRKISLRVEADTFTSHKVRHSAASLKLSNTNDLKQRIFCKASIRNAYYFHKIWILPAQWIKCSNGDMIIIASCRMAIFVKMIKTIGRWKLEGIGDDDEEKDYPPMMIEVLLAQTAHKRSSLWWSVVATEHHDHYNYIAHILNEKGQYLAPPIFSHWFSIIDLSNVFWPFQCACDGLRQRNTTILITTLHTKVKLIFIIWP